MLRLVTGTLATCVSMALAGTSLHAGTADGGGGETAATSNGQRPAREAGIRYGQALGVARVCYGLRTTEAASRLEQSYQGADGNAFRAEAERVLASWQEALSCTKAEGPNECRLIYEMSCRDAYREIGPEGSQFPGLVERAR